MVLLTRWSLFYSYEYVCRQQRCLDNPECVNVCLDSHFRLRGRVLLRQSPTGSPNGRTARQNAK